MAKASKKSRTRGRSAGGDSTQLSSGRNISLWIEQNFLFVVLGAVVLNLVLGAALFDPKPHTGGDNASYIFLAESILDFSSPYADNITPGEVKPHTQYPFGYPLILAPAVAVFGRNVAALKMISLLMISLCVVFTALLFRKKLSPPATLALILGIAVNPALVEYGHWVLSEGAFAAFAMLSLILMDRAESDVGEKKSFRYFIAAIVALAFTAHIRTIGMAFVIAGFVYFLLKKNWKRLVIFGLLSALLVGPWMIRNRLVSNREDSGYGSQLLMKNPYTPEQGNIGFGDLATRVGKNLKAYVLRETGRSFIGTEMPLGDGGAHKLISALIFSLCAVGLALSLFKGGIGFIEIYMLVFSGIVMVWPEVWSDVRFIMPVIPLILYYAYRGIHYGAVKFGAGGFGGKAAVTAVVIVAVLGLAFQLNRVPANLNMISRYMKGDHYAGYPVNWVHFFQAADWSKANTPENAVFTVRKPRLWHLKTNRLVRGYPFSTDRNEVYQDAVKSDYVVVDAVSGTTYRYLIPALQEHQEKFAVVFSLDNPLTAVLKVMK